MMQEPEERPQEPGKRSQEPRKRLPTSALPARPQRLLFVLPELVAVTETRSKFLRRTRARASDARPASLRPEMSMSRLGLHGQSAGRQRCTRCQHDAAEYSEFSTAAETWFRSWTMVETTLKCGAVTSETCKC